MQDKAGEKHPVVAEADELIAAAQRLGFSDAVYLLKMARLELVAQLNKITPEELKAFAESLGEPRDNVTSLDGYARRKLADALRSPAAQAE